MRHFLAVPAFLSLFLMWLPLTACNNSTQQSTSVETEHSANDGHDHSKDGEGHSANDGHDHSEHELHSKGGQVVESDPYHIELVTKPKDDGTQLNLYLLHEAEERVITDAKVTANVQQPNGEQQTLKLVYEPAEEGYTGLMTAQVTGQYDLVVQTDIGGEKMNSRFSVER